MEAIALDHLSFSYDGETPVLKDISLSIPQGSYTAIVGHNGSGKSTLAKLIIGLLEAGSGTIQVLGTPLTDETLSEVRDHVGIVFQNPDNQFIGSTEPMTSRSVWKTIASRRNRCKALSKKVPPKSE